MLRADMRHQMLAVLLLIRQAAAPSPTPARFASLLTVCRLDVAPPPFILHFVYGRHKRHLHAKPLWSAGTGLLCFDIGLFYLNAQSARLCRISNEHPAIYHP